MKIDLNDILHLIDRRAPTCAFGIYLIFKQHQETDNPPLDISKLRKMISSHSERTLYRNVKWLCDNGFLFRTSVGNRYKQGKAQLEPLEQFQTLDANDYSGIYKITNKANNKFYIGQSIKVNSRRLQHFKLLRKNKHPNWRLQHDFNKFGEHNFTWEALKKAEETELLKEEAREIHKALIDGDIQIYNLEIPKLINPQEDK